MWTMRHLICFSENKPQTNQALDFFFEILKKFFSEIVQTYIFDNFILMDHLITYCI